MPDKKPDTDKQNPRPHGLMLMGVALTIGTLESYTAYLLVHEVWGLATAAVAHLAVCIAGALLAWFSHRRQIDVNIYLLIVLLTFFIGPFGSAIALIATLRYIIYSKDSDAFADWLESLFPSNDDNASSMLYERICFGLNDKEGEYVESYYDLMIYGSIINKQTLIARVTRYFKPALSPVLQLALQDDNNIIRVQAAASIAKIENEFFTNYKEYEDKLKLDNDSYKANIAFSLSCIEYIESGILGDKRMQEIGQKTVLTLTHCMILNTSDETPRFLLGRLYLHLNEPLQAYEVVKPAINSDDFIIPEMVRVFITILYQLKKYSELRTFCINYLTGKMTVLLGDEELDSYISSWASCMIKPEWSKPLNVR